MRRAWTIDTAIDSAGLPVTVFSARAQDNDLDHRFFYSKFDGANWNTYEMAAAGGYLYSRENDYTGLVSIDPDNPNVVYMSTDVDPGTDLNLEQYEIFRGETEDGGATWNWAPITFFSTVDNLRPLVPKWNDEETVLIWMRGNYSTYHNWDTKVVALIDITPLDAVSIADLNGDREVTLEDHAILIAGMTTDLSDMTIEEAYEMGDLNGDLKINFFDDLIFEREFDLFNGRGAFANAIGFSVR